MQGPKLDVAAAIAEAYEQVLRLGASNHSARDMALALWRERNPESSDYEARHTVAEIIAKTRLRLREGGRVNGPTEPEQRRDVKDRAASAADGTSIRTPPAQT